MTAPIPTSANPTSLVRTLIGTAGVLLCHFIAVVVLGVVLAGVVPRYMKIYEESRLLLPAATVCTCELSRFVVHYWFLLVLALVPDAIVYFFLARLTPKVNWLAAVWGYLLPMGTVLVLGFASISLYMPLGESPPSPHSTVEEQSDSR